MEVEEFKSMVARLETESAASPAGYRMRVVALTLLGFGILALLLLIVGGGLALLAGFAVAVVVTGGKALLLLVKLGKFLILLAIPLWYLLRASISALLIRLPAPEGREIQRTDAPVLFAELDDMRRRMKGPRFHHVLIDDEVNAAVLQRPAFGLVGWPRNYLILGLPLLESMPAEEALAVVAHEYGHLAGSHSHFSSFIYRLRNTWATIQSTADQMQGWLAKLILPVLRWYAPYFNAYTFVLARANEYQADAASAALVGAANAANALKRVNLVAPQHRQFLEQTFDRIGDEAAPPADLMQRWAMQATQPPAAEDAARWLTDALDHEGHYTDTHPTLRSRLSALPDVGESLQQPPPPVSDATAAALWLGPLLNTLRQEFQSQWRARVAEPWAERHAHAQQQRQALVNLRELTERDAQQELEYLQLLQTLEPQVDLREPFAAFNAANVDHPLGLFLAGVEQLKRGDGEGIALLERVMLLDPDATKPACEQAHRFLLERKETDAAEVYAARWRERDEHEARIAYELDTLDPMHALAAHDFPVDDLAFVLPKLELATKRHVSAVYLVRRVLPSNPTTLSYVVGIDMSWLGGQLNRTQAVVDRVAAIEWPAHVLVCSLDGAYAPMKKKMAAIPGARLV